MKNYIKWVRSRAPRSIPLPPKQPAQPLTPFSFRYVFIQVTFVHFSSLNVYIYVYKGKPCSQQSSMKLVSIPTLTLKRSSLCSSVNETTLLKMIIALLVFCQGKLNQFTVTLSIILQVAVPLHEQQRVCKLAQYSQSISSSCAHRQI